MHQQITIQANIIDTKYQWRIQVARVLACNQTEEPTTLPLALFHQLVCQCLKLF